MPVPIDELEHKLLHEMIYFHDVVISKKIESIYGSMTHREVLNVHIFFCPNCGKGKKELQKEFFTPNALLAQR